MSFNHAARAVFHDHMNGSATCVECGGPCRLTDATQAAYTSLVRSICESIEHGQAIPYQVVKTLARNGVDVSRLTETEPVRGRQG